MTDPSPFEQFAASVDTPMLIVTAPGTRGRAGSGCLVGFSTQCSIDPVRYLVCLSKANDTYRGALGAASVVVHVLRDAELDRTLARLFGELTERDRDVDKFADCEWDDGPDGVPVLRGIDHFEGQVLNYVDLGDHVGFALAVGDGHVTRTDEPLLTYPRVKDLDAGNPA